MCVEKKEDWRSGDQSWPSLIPDPGPSSQNCSSPSQECVGEWTFESISQVEFHQTHTDLGLSKSLSLSVLVCG